MGLILAPIMEGKVEGWKNWTKELTGPKKVEFADFNKRYEVSRHSAWLAETPGGTVAVVLHEGPGTDTFLQKLGQSDHPFDKSFVKAIEEFNGMDLKSPPPGPPPVKMI
jgi:hypothetical protein